MSPTKTEPQSSAQGSAKPENEAENCGVGDIWGDEEWGDDLGSLPEDWSDEDPGAPWPKRIKVDL